MTEHHRTSGWQATVRLMRPIFKATIDAGKGICVNCGKPVTPGQRWQVGHITDAAVAKANGWSEQQINHPSNLGPSHTKGQGQRACNQIAGGKLGAAIVNDRKRTADRMPNW